jgi:mono/diheme cytochrome c family protein
VRRRIVLVWQGIVAAARRPLAVGLVLAAGWAGVWADAAAFEPAVNYMLHCMGCHTPDGRGEPGRVPSVRDTLVPFAKMTEGRKFLVQVPGSAQSRLSDAELAEVLNWMVDNLSASPGASAVRRFTQAEVAEYRRTPLVAVSAVRARLVSDARVPGANAPVSDFGAVKDRRRQ